MRNSTLDIDFSNHDKIRSLKYSFNYVPVHIPVSFHCSKFGILVGTTDSWLHCLFTLYGNVHYILTYIVHKIDPLEELCTIHAILNLYIGSQDVTEEKKMA